VPLSEPHDVRPERARREQETSDYHAQAAREVLAALEATESGLDSRDIEQRLSRHGRNELPTPQRKHPVL